MPSRRALEAVGLRVELRWWVVPYLRFLALMALSVGLEPDVPKIAETIIRLKGVRFYVGDREV